MKALLQFFGVISVVGAIIALFVHIGADRVIRESGIFIGIFATGLLQGIVFFALAEIIQKIDQLLTVFSNMFKSSYKENISPSDTFNHKSNIEPVNINPPNKSTLQPLVCPKCNNKIGLSYNSIEERKIICPKCSVTLIWGLPKQNECTRGII
jgi:hypothetical protein